MGKTTVGDGAALVKADGAGGVVEGGGVVLAPDGGVGEVAGFDGAFVVLARNGSDASCTFEGGAEVDAVGDSATVVAYDATDANSTDAVGGGEGGGAGAAGDGAVVVACDAAMPPYIVMVGVDGDGIEDVAVGDCAVAVSHDGTNVIVASDDGVGEDDVPHFGRVAD